LGGHHSYDGACGGYFKIEVAFESGIKNLELVEKFVFMKTIFFELKNRKRD
jgi:hypothetical protein